MKRYENEEYYGEELQIIDEIQYFEAEDFRVLELLENPNEDFKVLEIEKREIIDEPRKKTKGDKTDNLQKKINNLKTSINSSASTTLSVSIVGVTVAVGAGVILPPTKVEAQSIDFMHYVVDYQMNMDTGLEKNIRLYFNGELDDGYYCVVVNQETNETKVLDSNCVLFEGLKEEQYEFDVKIYSDEDKETNTFTINVDTVSEADYEGLKETNYEITPNNDSINFYLDIKEQDDLVNLVYLKDKDGNILNYESTYENNQLLIENIIEEEFSVYGGSYLEKNGNYYAVCNYQFLNLNKYINLDLERVEILNSSYDYNFANDFIKLYLDGNITQGSYFDLIAYNQVEEKIWEEKNIDRIAPVTFSIEEGLESVRFEIVSYGNDNEINKIEHVVDLTKREEYLNAEYDISMTNPMDVFITYNDDLTYNAYMDSMFKNNSEYDLVYKVELIANVVNEFDEFESKEMYSYIGSEEITLIKDISPNDNYSLSYKVFVKDGLNYYVLNDYMAPSGTIDIFITDGNIEATSGVYISENQYHIYSIDLYCEVQSDIEIITTLPTGEVITKTITKEDLEDTFLLDLTEYEFESVNITVKFIGNCNYGLGDLILEKESNIIGNRYMPVIYTYEY